MDCRLPGSSIHGIFQARVLEWVAIYFSRRSSQPRDPTQVSRIAGRSFTIWATRDVHSIRNVPNNTVITLYGNKWLLDSSRWSFHNVFKFISPYSTPKTSIILHFDNIYIFFKSEHLRKCFLCFQQGEGKKNHFDTPQSTLSFLRRSSLGRHFSPKPSLKGFYKNLIDLGESKHPTPGQSSHPVPPEWRRWLKSP